MGASHLLAAPVGRRLLLLSMLPTAARETISLAAIEEECGVEHPLTARGSHRGWHQDRGLKALLGAAGGM